MSVTLFSIFTIIDDEVSEEVDEFEEEFKKETKQSNSHRRGDKTKSKRSAAIAFSIDFDDGQVGECKLSIHFITIVIYVFFNYLIILL